MVYLSILRRSRFIPGTVSTRPSNESEIWNSLKRQAATLAVVALESPTWSLRMMGVLMDVPTKVLTSVSKSDSRGEAELHTLVSTLVGTSINTPIILNDQVGLSRATTASVAACLFKEFQISASFEGLVETVPGMNLDLLKMDRYTMDMNKDALF